MEGQWRLMLRGALGLLVFAVLFAGTVFFGGRAVGAWEKGNETPRPPAADGSALGAADGWTTYTVRREGFALDLPIGWQPVTARSLEDRVAPFTHGHPWLLRTLRKAFGEPDPRVKLFAFDLRLDALDAAHRTGVATSFAVRVTPGAKPSPKERGPDLERSRRVSRTVYVFWRKGRRYVVAFTTSRAQEEDYASLFGRSAASFRFVRRTHRAARPAVDPAEARWVDQANGLCRAAGRELRALVLVRRPSNEELIELAMPLNERYHEAFAALETPKRFERKVRKLHELFARDERLFVRLAAAVRSRNQTRVLSVAGRLVFVSQAESRIMGALGASACDEYGFAPGA